MTAEPEMSMITTGSAGPMREETILAEKTAEQTVDSHMNVLHTNECHTTNVHLRVNDCGIADLTQQSSNPTNPELFNHHTTTMRMVMVTRKTVDPPLSTRNTNIGGITILMTMRRTMYEKILITK